MKIIDGIPVWGEPDPGALSQIKTCAKTADHVALMADHHKGYAVPIGGVIAYRNHISPSGVGYDIGCGNKAVLTDMPGESLRNHIKTIMNDIWGAIAFGIGRKNDERVDHPLFDNYVWKSQPQIGALRAMAQNQLGTVGSGNHYVDLFTDEVDRVWVGCHFGSRGLGHKTATYFLNAAGAKDGMDVEPCIIPTDATLGADYIQAMTLAGEYAYAGRDWVCQKVANILGAKVLDEVHNHHNFAWREWHNGEYLWVVRKGATPAFPGQRGFVGGSMGEQSVILEGIKPTTTKDAEAARLALYSTVHGAGRVMGRMEAAGKYKDIARWRCQDRDCEYTAAKGGYFKEEGGPTPKCPICGHKLRLETMKQQIRPGKVTNEMMSGWLTRANVELRGGGLDESPDCYKRLNNVLTEHAGTVRILHTLTPVGVAMAGKDEFDPYKD
jgi:tRNA-splicing ligase RtcB